MYSISQIVFKAIDVFFYYSQNGLRFQNIEEIRDVEYVPGGGVSRSGNIYYDKNLAAKGRKFPVIVYIHGGGFVMGDKNYRWTFCEYLAHNGYFVFDINYRMPPTAVFPIICNDCVDGLNYVAELAKEYNLDLDKIIVTGDSSGGYLTSYVTALAHDENLRKAVHGHEVKVKIAALAPFCGIYDIQTLLSTWMPLGLAQDTAGLLFGMHVNYDKSNLKDYEYFDYVSPYAYVNDDWPIAYIVWAEKDMVCVNQGAKMAQQLKEHCPIVGTDSQPEIYNNHCYHLDFRKPVARRCFAKFIRFLKSVDLY